MVREIDNQSTEPVPKFDKRRSNAITHSPRKLILASIDITIPSKNAYENHVKLNAKVGLRGINGTSKILFTIYRNGVEIYTTKEVVESDSSTEENYITKIKFTDLNVGDGSHTYKVTAENMTTGTESVVVGPISFRGIAREGDSSRDREHGKNGSRNYDKKIVRELDSELDRLVRILERI